MYVDTTIYLILYFLGVAFGLASTAYGTYVILWELLERRWRWPEWARVTLALPVSLTLFIGGWIVFDLVYGALWIVRQLWRTVARLRVAG
jgi:hypothetical protein